LEKPAARGFVHLRSENCQLEGRVVASELFLSVKKRKRQKQKRKVGEEKIVGNKHKKVIKKPLQ